MILYLTYEAPGNRDSFSLSVATIAISKLLMQGSVELPKHNFQNWPARLMFSRLREISSFHATVDLELTLMKCTEIYSTCVQLLFCSLKFPQSTLPKPEEFVNGGALSIPVCVSEISGGEWNSIFRNFRKRGRYGNFLPGISVPFGFPPGIYGIFG